MEPVANPTFSVMEKERGAGAVLGRLASASRTVAKPAFSTMLEGGEKKMKKWFAAIMMVVAIVAATSANFHIG
ncbi:MULTISPECIES: hypothetical protein [Brevibacillus]|uniref:hypothetical protein n=1 Tax=Brevibacillus TaxID=55080 RepID=UPI00156A7CF6|nr:MULTISPECIES: hypothetical protein [Bacillales]MBH0328322.1 hypothetical protein [Brevibacillus brevis]NRR03431.1 hypothetical protein [Brevibacillus sp. RS1.1]NRS49359.1 hypothetical protein [Brevibacillus sp. HB2.2]UIO42062.1 hypothetical protein LOY85_25255 [Brevibacillus brevis]